MYPSGNAIVVKAFPEKEFPHSIGWPPLGKGEWAGQHGLKGRVGSRGEPLIPKHGGYRRLKSFQIAQLVYDVTARFCDRYIDKKSRTHDQTVQAARSGVQNIAKGSLARGTSKKMELKLTHVARASLEELRLDFEGLLRQRNMRLWDRDDPRRKALLERRCTTANEVVEWVREIRGPDRQDGRSIESISSTKSTYPEIAANAVLVLIGVAVSL